MFLPDTDEDQKNKGLGKALKTMFQNLLSFGENAEELRQMEERQNLVRNQEIIKQLKHELK